MTTIERFKNVMDFKPTDRLPVIEFAPWWTLTIERWLGEGLPKEIQDAGEIRDYLGLDCYRQLWVTCIGEDCPSPAYHGAGIIKNESDYDKILPCLYPEKPLNISLLEKWAKSQKKGELVIWLTLEGFFWHPRVLFGIENHLYAFYDNGKLMKRINEDLSNFILNIIKQICRICQPSFMTFAEDMSYNHGPMLSKDCFDEFLAPHYKCIVGDVTAIIPWLKETGIEGILPLERQAGVDVAQIRSNHPKFKMIGAFDKTIMHLGENAMRKEFERLLPVMKTGGFIPSVDHQTPPDVSFENYKCYLSLLKEYCTKAMEKYGQTF